MSLSSKRGKQKHVLSSEILCSQSKHCGPDLDFNMHLTPPGNSLLQDDTQGNKYFKTNLQDLFFKLTVRGAVLFA